MLGNTCASSHSGGDDTAHIDQGVPKSVPHLWNKKFPDRRLLIRRWTEADIFAIRAMAEQRMSSSMIADEYGVTRNSIIGFCARNGIKLNSHRNVGGNLRARFPSKPRALSRQARPPVPVRAIAPEPAPEGPGKPFLDLTGPECHWPLGALLEPSEFWCGHSVQHDESYCPYHYRKSIQTHRVCR